MIHQPVSQQLSVNNPRVNAKIQHGLQDYGVGYIARFDFVEQLEDYGDVFLVRLHSQR
jgi:hypothetical protein